MVGRALISGYGVGSVLLFTSHMRVCPACKMSSAKIAVKIAFELSKFMHGTNFKHTFGIFLFSRVILLRLLFLFVCFLFVFFFFAIGFLFSPVQKFVKSYSFQSDHRTNVNDRKWKAQRPMNSSSFFAFFMLIWRLAVSKTCWMAVCYGLFFLIRHKTTNLNRLACVLCGAHTHAHRSMCSVFLLFVFNSLLIFDAHSTVHKTDEHTLLLSVFIKN